MAEGTVFGKILFLTALSLLWGFWYVLDLQTGKQVIYKQLKNDPPVHLSKLFHFLLFLDNSRIKRSRDWVAAYYCMAFCGLAAYVPGMVLAVKWLFSLDFSSQIILIFFLLFFIPYWIISGIFFQKSKSRRDR